MNLYNSVFLFRIYLTIAIIFLFPLCSFITLELSRFLVYYYLRFIKFSKSSHDLLKVDDVFILFKYYLKKKEWFSCIIMLEFFQELQNINYSNSLGICYQKISLNSIARYYYLQALEHDSMNLIVLHNLASVYDKIGNKEKAIRIYKKIISINSNDKVATKFLINQ